MQVSSQDIATLKRLQDIDVAATNDRRELDGLPQRKQLEDLRQKIAAIREKQQQVEKLAEANRTDQSRAVAEIEILDIRKEETQRKINDAGSDFRAIESLSKDMGSMEERTQELEDNHQALKDREGQIAGVKRQIEQALGVLDGQEAALAESLQGKTDELQGRLDQAQAEHDQLIATLPTKVATEYERARKHCGGVALSVLVDGQCTTCRSVLEETRLLQVRREAPLGVCPMCHRLLIIQ